MKVRQFTTSTAFLVLLSAFAVAQTNGQPERFTANAVC